jgi:tetratricopeptide (TPR) repeat protein
MRPCLTLVRALRMYNEPVALLECVEHSRWRERRSATWLTDLAMMVSTIGANELAMEMLDLAIIREPNNPQARYFRGVVQMFFGDMEAAERELELCIAKAPGFTQAHWVLSRLRKQTEDANHVERMRALIPKVPRGSESDSYLAFALHNELHDLGRYADSWQALQQGCRCKRQLTPHDRTDARRMYDGLMVLADEQFVQPIAQPEATFVPVFHRRHASLRQHAARAIAGRPSDGGRRWRDILVHDAKCAMRRITATRAWSMPNWSGARPTSITAWWGRRFHEATAWRAKGKPYLTEKLPSNFLNLGFIAKALPQARILHMVRDPLDTCFSNLRTMFSDVNTFSYDQRELAEWYGQYRQLMAHWHKVDARPNPRRPLRRVGGGPRGCDAWRARILRPAVGRSRDDAGRSRRGGHREQSADARRDHQEPQGRLESLRATIAAVDRRPGALSLTRAGRPSPGCHFMPNQQLNAMVMRSSLP